MSDTKSGAIRIILTLSQRTSMTSNQETRPLPPASENTVGPGQLLRRARENKRLSIDAVAANLHVLPKVIVALEGDDFAKLPSSVYVRGYLRSYARMVDLSAESLIDLYNQKSGSEVAPIAVAADADTEERPLRWGYYLGVLVLLVLTVLWVNRDNLTRYWSDTGRNEAALAPDESAPPSVPPPAVAEPAGITRPEKSAAPPVTPGIAQAPASAVPAPAAPSPSAQAVASPPAIGQGPDALTVSVAADAWVAIRDASGKRLVYETLPAGTVRSMRGQAPFALVLGNASSARVEFNGQPVDHSKYIVGAVARFKVSN